MNPPKIKYLPLVIAPLLITSCSTDNEVSRSFNEIHPEAPSFINEAIGNKLGHPILGTLCILAAVTLFLAARWETHRRLGESENPHWLYQCASGILALAGLIMILTSFLK